LKNFLFTLLAFLLLESSLSAQKITRPVFDITHLQQDPAVDGNVLTDAIWESVPPIEGLQQMRPDYGQAVSERTVIRVAQTSRTLYVAVICFDQDPSKIVVSDSRRDADLNDDDSFLFIIDTYNDQQNGFLFGTNADGMEYDAQIDREGVGNFNANRQQGGVIGGTNINWDAAWTVKTERGEYGWSAEFAIPLRSIRFNSGDDRIWGINFQRNISKRSETAYWAQLPVGLDIKRLSLAGKMHGLSLRSPKNLKVFPYVLGQNTVRKKTDPAINKTDAAAGVDVKYSLTPGLTLDLTYNTDFAQVEVDDQQVNLERVNLFFPEKRPFFLENAGQFTVGSPGEVDLFFSRRIGIAEQGRIVPITGGARVSGKIGQTNVGLLSMFTESIADIDLNRNNFSVARINHDFAARRSSIGAVYVGRQGLDANGEDYNRVVAIDGKWGIGKQAQISGYLAKSNTPGMEDRDHALNILGVYNWNGWNLRLGYTEVAEQFNPEVGFLLRTAFKKPEFLILRNWRPDNWGPIMELRPHVSYRAYINFENQLETSFLHVDNHWEFDSGFEIHTGVNFTTEGVYKPLYISGVEIPKGTYTHQELQFVLLTNANKMISYTNTTVIGGYFGGSRFSSRNMLSARIGDKLNTSFSFNYNDLRLPEGDINAIISAARIAYSFTPRIFLQSLIQYNNVSEVTSVNARFGWLQNSNTGLFVVYNIIRDRDLFFPANDQVFTIKYTHQFDLIR
jgi:hypothetical protein